MTVLLIDGDGVQRLIAAPAGAEGLPLPVTIEVETSSYVFRFKKLGMISSAGYQLYWCSWPVFSEDGNATVTH